MKAAKSTSMTSTINDHNQYGKWTKGPNLMEAV